MADEFWLEVQQVVDECCPKILASPKGSTGRLELLRQWIYKPQGHEVSLPEVQFRLAPSVIVRSEAELFGVSSPRFAIRAYLSDRSFVNIRRNKVLQQMIGETIKNGQSKQQLLKELKRPEFAWTADSLLEIPTRFELSPEFVESHPSLSSHPQNENGFHFLTANLGNEYGEDFDGPLVPFVTHISVGGGLCAQASCFMSLCLTDCKQVLGISEITKLAWADQAKPAAPTGKLAEVTPAVGKPSNPAKNTQRDGVIKIIGLSSERMAAFFTKEEIGLDAQLQTMAGENNERFIKFAIQTYIANQIPLNAILSISRMQGSHLKQVHSNKQLQPILKLNGYEFDDDDRSQLPIGLVEPDQDDDPPQNPNDHHCVVIVGASEKKVCINDPATFPFIEASFQQLYDARAYMPKQRDEAICGEAIDQMRTIDPAESHDQKLPPFRFVSVTPREVKLPLLDFVINKRDDEKTLVDIISGQIGLLRLAFDTQQEERLQMKQPDAIVPNIGRYFLVQKRTGDNDAVQLISRRAGLPDFDWSLVTGIPDDWYWVQSVKHPLTLEDHRQMLWFWRASATGNEIRSAKTIVLMETDHPGSDSQWTVRPQNPRPPHTAASNAHHQ